MNKCYLNESIFIKSDSIGWDVNNCPSCGPRAEARF